MAPTSISPLFNTDPSWLVATVCLQLELFYNCPMRQLAEKYLIPMIGGLAHCLRATAGNHIFEYFIHGYPSGIIGATIFW